jgi:hypothetical protein
MFIRHVIKSALLPGLVAGAFFMFSCDLSVKQKPIHVQDVDSVLMYCRLPGDTDQSPVRKLSIAGTEKFLHDLNTAVYAGPRKFLPSYTITVYKKDHTEQYFKTKSNYISGRTDECFEMPGAHYFDDLWNNPKK